MSAKLVSGNLPAGSAVWRRAWIAFFICFLFSIMGWWFYRLAAPESMLFFLGVLFAFYIPGTILVRSVHLSASHFLTLPVLSLTIGSVIVPMGYRFLRWSEIPDSWLLTTMGLVSIYWLYDVYKRRNRGYPSIRGSSADYWALATLFITLLLLLHFSHFSDVILGAQGFQFRSHYMSESVFHLGLINALTDTYPPPALYASGSPDFSSYHLNMHLQIEMLNRLFGLDPLKLVHFYFPLFYFGLVVLLPFVFIRETGGASLTALLGALIIFGADLSFLAVPWVIPEEAIVWTTIFQTSIWSLFTLNGYIPSLIALFLSIFLLRDLLSANGVWKAMVIGLVAYAAFGFKSSMGLHLAASSLALGSLMVWDKDQRKAGLLLFLASVMALLFMVLDLKYIRSSVGNNSVSFEPMNHLNSIVERFGFLSVPIDWIAPLVLLFLLASLGGRAFGLYYLANNLKLGEKVDWNLAFIGLFFIIGYAVTEFFVIGNSAGQNNAGWFYIQSLIASCFLLFPLLISIQKRKTAYFFVVGVLALMLIPSTVQFLTQRVSSHYLSYGPEELALIDYMKTTNPDSVFLHPISEGEPSLAANFAGRPTVLSTWVSFVTENEGLSERVVDVELFFDPASTPSGRIEILKKYSIDYVYGPQATLQIINDLPNVNRELVSGSLVLYRIN